MSPQLSAGSKQATTGSTPERETASETTDLPLDVVYELLSNERRRRALRYLIADAEPTTLGEIAEHIASIENGKPTAELSSTERKRVYICLYQCHLPKMDDADVIDFDENRKTIELAENAEDLMTYLPGKEDPKSSDSTDRWRAAFVNIAHTIGRRFLSAKTR